ncbi:MAG: acyl-CoA synthetase [Raineya sp.]|nr:acyl-CoA synthetase [Raineya sp.]
MLWIEKTAQFGAKTALRDETQKWTYQELFSKAQKVAIFLLEKLQVPHLQGARIAYLFPSCPEYVAVQWGIWLAGGMAVPLSPLHPKTEMEYFIQDSEASLLILHDNFSDLNFSVPSISWDIVEGSLENLQNSVGFPEIALHSPALMIYTSGTTGKPKGVMLSHKNLTFQIETLVKAWEWQKTDKILHVLPLHHIHGIVNALLCALYAGAEVVFLPKFEPQKVWDIWQREPFSVFMAVPTIYNRLIAEWQKATENEKRAMQAACQNMRLMISGSAALPVSILEKWQKISGHFLLERYGMSEIGMAISNPLHGTRKAGFVGLPLPNIEVRLVDENNQPVLQGEAGEIQVKGENVFMGYWKREQATAESFTDDGFFKTGDIAIQDTNGYYKILGRKSTDIIKTAGYKVSAIEIEETLRLHSEISDCAVVGIADEDKGEKIIAFVIAQSSNLNENNLKDWLKTQLAYYKVPAQIIFLQDFPRNAMGKVIKTELKNLLK